MRTQKQTQTKRNCERGQQMKRQDKLARREQRKGENAARRPPTDGEDPALEGLRLGPQPPLF